MSFIIVKGQPLVLQWPDPYASVFQHLTPRIKDAQHRVPETNGGLYDWAYVGENRSSVDRSRRFRLLYQPSVTGKKGVQVPVQLHIQGFVHLANLTALGTWTGRETDAHRAVQIITLHGLGHSRVFDRQVEAVNDLTQIALRRVGGVVGRRNRENQIYLQRHVFTKNIDGNSAAGIQLDEMDDPDGSAAKIARRWIVTSQPRFGRLNEKGTIV